MAFDLAGKRQWTIQTLLIMIALIMAGCVRPVEETPTPSDQVANAPTMTGAGQVTQPPAQQPTPLPVPPAGNEIARIQTFFQNQGFTLNNVQIFTQVSLGLDTLIAFTYQNTAGQFCIGIAQVSPDTVWSGDTRCGNTPLAGTLLFQPIANPAPHIAVYGYVDPAVAPDASAVSVQFVSSLPVDQMLNNYGFIIARQGLDFPTQAVFIKQSGDLVGIVPLQ